MSPPSGCRNKLPARRSSSPPWATTPEPASQHPKSKSDQQRPKTRTEMILTRQKAAEEPAGQLLESKSEESDQPRPKTRTELILTRHMTNDEQARRNTSLAATHRRGKEDVAALGECSGDDWWTLVDGYTENAMEALASCPRIQRYMSKRAKALAAEKPDPFNTHEVKIRNPPQPVTDNIATAAPPPADADAYTTPRRATKRFTDEVFAWNRRLNPHDDLDEHGKEKYSQSGVTEPTYSSLSPIFTGCSLDPQGHGCSSPRLPQQAKAGRSLRSLQATKPDPAEVARQAIKQRKHRREALSTVIKNGAKDNVSADTSRGSQASPRSSVCSAHTSSASEYDNWIGVPLLEKLAPQESNRRRCSRLCGYG